MSAYWLAISTPGEMSGRFYEIHARRAGLQDWHVEHVTLAEAVAAGRISVEWAEQRRQQWGESSAVYQSRVLGNFADSAEDALIPLAWAEAAVERHQQRGGRSDSDRLGVGVDPARFGDDRSAIAVLRGSTCVRLSYHAKQDTMQTTGRVAALLERKTPVAVDVIGLGAGVVDRLRELGYREIDAVNAGAAAKDRRGKPLTDASGELNFVNMRSYLWWILRESLDPAGADPLALFDDDDLLADLTAPTFNYTSRGQIVVESKDDIRRRLRRSTDGADALALALFAQQQAGRRGLSAQRAVAIEGMYRSRREQRGQKRRRKARPTGR